MFLLVENSKVLCSTANELQQNFFFFIEEYIPWILTVLYKIHQVYDPIYIILTSVAFCLSFLDNR